MASREEIETKILNYMAVEMLNGDAEGLVATTNLLALGVIDSLSVGLLRMFVYDTFGVKLDTSEPSDFATVEVLSALVERRHRENAG